MDTIQWHDVYSIDTEQRMSSVRQNIDPMKEDLLQADVSSEEPETYHKSIWNCE